MKRVLIILLLLSGTAQAGFIGYVKADTETIIVVGPFVDVSNGYVPETGITLGAADETALLKAATTTVTDISGATWAAITSMDGYYALTLQSGWADTEGLATIAIQDDDVCLPVKCTFMVMNDNSYEAFFENASEILTVNVTQVGGTSQTANDNGADINAILTDTAEIGAAGAGLTAVPWNAAWDAEVESEVEDAVGADVTSILADTGTDGVIVASVNADAIEAGDFKTDAIDADALNTDAVAEIWAKALSDLAAGVPSATASVLTAINYLYEAWRNKTVTDGTNSEVVIYKDDGNTKLVESDISDDGTDFTRGEMGAPD